MVTQSSQVKNRRGVGVSLSLDELLIRLESHYRAAGFSAPTIKNDLLILRRMGHPDTATMEDVERVLANCRKQSCRVHYAARMKVLIGRLRRLGLTASTLDDQIPTMKLTRSTPRPLSPRQVERLMGEATGRFRDWFTLGLYSGLRAMEVSSLCGSDLDYAADGPTLRVRGKGRTDITLPVAQAVADVIEAQGTLGRLWHYSPHTVSINASAEMRRILGVEDVTFHALRHTYATRLLALTGGDITTVAELMRHANIQTTLRYTKLDVAKQRTAVQSLGEIESSGGGGGLGALAKIA